MRGTPVKLEGVTKRFRNVVAVCNLNLEISGGELLVLLGPSGCGKTTTLRVVAGLEIPDEGRVYIDNTDVTYLEPGERGVAMVFQDYALYPHMTAFDNIAFPLKVRAKRLRLSKRDIEERVLRVAKMLGIESLLDRKPTQLSGGQQQRVALARALVTEPRVWLMDEPLSNLDALIRLQVRAELKKLQKDLGITTIYVTHDQVEALSLADRVAVMNAGRIVQVGTPREVYENPQHIFVATFIGAPPMNIVKCKVSNNLIECPGFVKRIPGEKLQGLNTIHIGIRPEHIELTRREESDIEGVVYVVEPLGAEYIINVLIDKDTLIKVKTIREVQLSTGDKVYLRVDWKKAVAFDPATGQTLADLLPTLKGEGSR